MAASPGSYNGPTARLCAELSYVSYARSSEIRRVVPGFVENPAIEMRTSFLGNSRVLVVSGANEIFVVFRGTVPTSVRSLLANTPIARTRWGNGSVHVGFLALFLMALPFIVRQLRKYQTGAKAVYLTGHSQGGAVAYLGAMTFRLREGMPDPAAVYTFGQPRAGNAAFSRDAETRLGRLYSRIANGKDIIVGVPFVWSGYDHSQEYLRYGRDWSISRRRQAPRQGWPFFTASLSDHDMLQYLRRSHVNESRPPV